MSETREITIERARALERNRVTRQRKKRRRKNILVFLVVLLLMAAGGFLFLKSSYFNIKEIKASGMKYYSELEVISISGAQTGRNIIFDSGIEEVEENLKKNPYFKSIKVKRKLPSTIDIEVEERTQLAAAVMGDSFIVIDEEGFVLRKSEIDPKLTLITGLTLSKINLGEPIDAEESENLNTTLKMLNIMRDGDMYFKKIDVSRVVNRGFIYDNLVVKGTPSEMMSAIESGELQKVVKDLIDGDISRGTITLGGSNYISFSPKLEEG